MVELEVNGENRDLSLYPMAVLGHDDEDGENWMDDRGQRIEDKLNEALKLLHQQEGEKKARDREIVDMKVEHKELEKSLALFKEKTELESGRQREILNQVIGSARTFKWLASLGGAAGGGTLLFELLRNSAAAVAGGG